MHPARRTRKHQSLLRKPLPTLQFIFDSSGRPQRPAEFFSVVGTPATSSALSAPGRTDLDQPHKRTGPLTVCSGRQWAPRVLVPSACAFSPPRECPFIHSRPCTSGGRETDGLAARPHGVPVYFPGENIIRNGHRVRRWSPRTHPQSPVAVENDRDS